MTRGLLLLLKMFRDVKPEDADPAKVLYKLADAYLKFSQEQSYLFKMLAVVENPAVSEQVSPEVSSDLEEASDGILTYVAGFVQRGMDDGIFRSDISSHEAVILFWVSLNGILNLKERSLAMKKNNCLKAESIIGSVDFDVLYGMCQHYLVDFLTQEETRKLSGRNAARKPKVVQKHSKAVTQK